MEARRHPKASGEAKRPEAANAQPKSEQQAETAKGRLLQFPGGQEVLRASSTGKKFEGDMTPKEVDAWMEAFGRGYVSRLNELMDERRKADRYGVENSQHGASNPADCLAEKARREAAQLRDFMSQNFSFDRAM